MSGYETTADNIARYRRIGEPILAALEALMPDATPAARPCLEAARVRVRAFLDECDARAAKIGAEAGDAETLRAAMSAAQAEIVKCKQHRAYMMESGKFDRADLRKLDDELSFQTLREQSCRYRFERAHNRAVDLGRLEQLSRQLKSEMAKAQESTNGIVRALLEEGENRGYEHGVIMEESADGPARLDTIGLLLSTETAAIETFAVKLERAKIRKGRFTAEGASGPVNAFVSDKEGDEFTVPRDGVPFSGETDARVEQLRAAFRARFGRLLAKVAASVDKADREKFAATFAAALGAA